MNGYFGSWKKRVAIAEDDFKRMNFHRRELLLLYVFKFSTNIYLPSKDYLSIFGQRHKEFPI